MTLTGNQVRQQLGLRSTWFSPALLQLSPTARTITYGGALSLRGAVHGADDRVARGEAVGRCLGRCGAAAVCAGRDVRARRQAAGVDAVPARVGRRARRVGESRRRSAGVGGRDATGCPGHAPPGRSRSTGAAPGAAGRRDVGDAHSTTCRHSLRVVLHRGRSRQAPTASGRHRATASARACRRRSPCSETAHASRRACGARAPRGGAAFANTEPYAAKEWYLDQDEAWSFWPTTPSSRRSRSR